MQIQSWVVSRGGQRRQLQKPHSPQAISEYTILLGLRQVKVFSDANSVMDRRQNWPAARNDPILGEVFQTVDALSGVASVIFQCVPGHCSISDNFWANILARRPILASNRRA